jgi:hypothetical protein
MFLYGFFYISFFIIKNEICISKRIKISIIIKIERYSITLNAKTEYRILMKEVKKCIFYIIFLLVL